MNKTLISTLLISISLAATPAYAFSFSDLLSGLLGKDKTSTEQQPAAPAAQDSSQTSSIKSTVAQLSNGDMVGALKAALQQGAQKASDELSRPDGFLNDKTVKIGLPPNTQKIADTLDKAGLGTLVNTAVESLNHAAEDAASKAAPIFIDAIKTISIDDAKALLTGGDNAATQYLRDKTWQPLTQAFEPIIQQSLGQVGAEKAWQAVFDAYNKIPFVNKKVETDLAAYTTEQSLNGVFVKMAEQEKLIRQNPQQQTSELIKKVFSQD